MKPEKTKLGFLFLFLLTGGCTLSAGQLAKLPNEMVCTAYGVYSAADWPESKQQMKGEIERRNLMTTEEMTFPGQSKQLFIGMSQCAMYASLGAPTYENRSVSSEGVRIQHIYGDNRILGFVFARNGVAIGQSAPVGRLSAVYTENGRVIGWQD